MQGTTYTAVYGAAAEKLGANTYWMLQDGQGSTRQLLDSSQATVAAYITDAYGNSVSSGGTATNPFKWNGGSGYYSDAESGLQKVGARYYEPATGRWISQDSLLIAGSPVDGQALNRYAYCEGNPVGGVDASGHSDPVWLYALINGMSLVPFMTQKEREEVIKEARKLAGESSKPGGTAGSGSGTPPPIKSGPPSSPPTSSPPAGGGSSGNGNGYGNGGGIGNGNGNGNVTINLNITINLGPSSN